MLQERTPSRWISCAVVLAIGLTAVLAIAIFVWFILGGSSEPKSNVLEGEPARRALADNDAGTSPPWLPFVRDCLVWEGGGFGGMNSYVSCECESIDRCWEAVLSPCQKMPNQSELSRSNFSSWSGSKYAIVMEGPAFYEREYFEHRVVSFAQWKLDSMGPESFAYESSDSDHRRIDFRAVDPVHRRFYAHYESGGFPDAPAPSGSASRRP